MTVASYRIVPISRELHDGIEGRDVTAVQRALTAAKCRVGRPRQRLYDADTVKSVTRFQQRHGLHADGVYGQKTHGKLAPFFDDYGAWLMGLREAPGVPVEERRRAAIVSAMQLLLSNRDAVHYRQLRPIDGVKPRLRPPEFPTKIDCSGAVTWAYLVGGAPDPNGREYDGSGYTGTLAQHGQRVRLADAKPADLVFYGDPFGADAHVAVYVGGGRVISQGSEPGPFLLATSYRPITDVRTYPLGGE